MPVREVLGFSLLFSFSWLSRVRTPFSLYFPSLAGANAHSRSSVCEWIMVDVRMHAVGSST
jgi:hypothetical protein